MCSKLRENCVFRFVFISVDVVMESSFTLAGVLLSLTRKQVTKKQTHLGVTPGDPCESHSIIRQ